MKPNLIASCSLVFILSAFAALSQTKRPSSKKNSVTAVQSNIISESEAKKIHAQRQHNIGATNTRTAYRRDEFHVEALPVAVLPKAATFAPKPVWEKSNKAVVIKPEPKPLKFIEGIVLEREN